jgi:transcriptional regulator with XRE-family HTH domain
MELKNLRELRRFRKITIKHLVTLTGISRNTLSRIEQGKANPTVETLEKIESALNIKIIITL